MLKNEPRLFVKHTRSRISRHPSTLSKTPGFPGAGCGPEILDVYRRQHRQGPTEICRDFFWMAWAHNITGSTGVWG